ncbi:MAG TPA: hypothetical protein VK508_07190 [Cyclobacteriaceae bacterium]|nr:hypothetical protein [Cyclobacteriaceae bacterium]
MKNVIGSCLAAGLIFLASCEDKLDFNAKDTANVENEAAVDGYFEDTDDMSMMVVSADNGTLNGSRDAAGRGIGKDRLDFRFSCNTTTVTMDFAEDNTQANPHGTIMIDFGADGCTDPKGNIRKGKIRVEFRGRRFLPGSSVVTTTEGYSINGVALEGTRTVTNVSGSNEEAPKFNVKLENGKATWPDGTFGTREVDRTREWVRAANPTNDLWRVTGTASGTNRNNDVYEMEITKALVYKRECALGNRVFMAVEGTKELTVKGKLIIIDYGTGECDKTVTITVDGQSKQVEVRGDI